MRTHFNPSGNYLKRIIGRDITHKILFNPLTKESKKVLITTSHKSPWCNVFTGNESECNEYFSKNYD